MDDPETRAKSCLNRIIELWQVETSRMKWLEAKAGSSAGFEWWPGDYQVLVRATTSRESNTNGTIKLTVRTSFLRQIDPNRFSKICTIVRSSISGKRVFRAHWARYMNQKAILVASIGLYRALGTKSVKANPSSDPRF